MVRISCGKYYQGCYYFKFKISLNTLFHSNSALFCAGVATAIQNIGLGTSAYVAGMLSKADDTYVMLETFYIASLILVISITSVLWYSDVSQLNYLLVSNEERKLFDQAPESLENMELDTTAQLINTNSTNGRYDFDYGGFGKNW